MDGFQGLSGGAGGGGAASSMTGASDMSEEVVDIKSMHPNLGMDVMYYV